MNGWPKDSDPLKDLEIMTQEIIKNQGVVIKEPTKDNLQSMLYNISQELFLLGMPANQVVKYLKEIGNSVDSSL